MNQQFDLDAMADPDANWFDLAYGLAADGMGFDFDALLAAGHLAAAGLFPAAAALPAGAALPAAGAALPAGAALLPGAAIPAALPFPDVVDLDQDPKNPWRTAVKRRFRCVRGRAAPVPDPPAPEERVCENEVPWVPKIGTRRDIRKHSQSRKSKYVCTKDGPGYYVFGTYGPNSLEF